MPTAVSRFKCRSDLYEMDLQLDINVDIYPLLASPVLSWCTACTLKQINARVHFPSVLHQAVCSETTICAIAKH